MEPRSKRRLDQDKLLRVILEGTAQQTGEEFFAALVRNLAQALGTNAAWVTEYLREAKRLRAISFWVDGGYMEDFEHDIVGTPCEAVVEGVQFVHIEDNILELYPDDKDVENMGTVSYMGVPLQDVDGNVMGHLAVMDRRPMPADPDAIAVFRIFAARATAELQRLKAEARTREREEHLGRLVDNAMDAIIDLDAGLSVLLLNPAARRVFGVRADDGFAACLTPGSYEKLARLIATMGSGLEGKRSLWVPGGLEAINAKGQTFTAEATFSSSEQGGRTFYTLIMRDVEERLRAEKQIESLTVEAKYLREEIRALNNFGDIIGSSPAIRRVMESIGHVAATDSTVLILGETGVGKEVVARAIHGESARKDRVLIRVNCGAIPAQLMESEFFGHEKGAFTGATSEREGRFALADGGTIFLDEIGELPPDLQVKLLRVLQEGEFEPVGSNKTRKVDVRVVAATNRNLERDVADGKFREDLYYRLNVFPIIVPPLRERCDDIAELAENFAQSFAKRLARPLKPLTDECKTRLAAYHWPGNVRELRNVIERAVITAVDGRLNLDYALPETAKRQVPSPMPSPNHEGARIHTVEELRELERLNILRALDVCDWRVAGENGAAKLLGMKPSTLASRIKALQITRVQ